uniref:Uncharacterized protein n=1 Tax=Lactuca sativa TaxID=4236 RepID=A0A9R1WWU6_LACSA|nr:hypothetical protein LSAT_V11C800406420 [Lactuca sativa]
MRQRCESSNVEKKRRKSINRDGVATTLFLLYDLSKFKDRFRINRNLILRIARDLENNYEGDARGKRGFTTFQKCTTTFKQLAYVIVTDALDEYLKIFVRIG